MTPPGLLTRVAGYPPITLLLFVGYGYIGYAWFQGHVRFLLAALTLSLAINTLKALARVARYQQWRAAWDRMAAPDDDPPLPRRGGLGKLITVGVWGVLLGVPLLITYVVRNRYHADELMALWCVVAGSVVLVTLVQLTRGLLHRSRIYSEAKALAASVAWMLRRAPSSPSWRSARRRVPDYARQVLRAKTATPRLERVKPEALAEP
jgi:hypothetical protein